ncbi:MAG: divalent heavy-metal cations transporter [Actinobacteria bacterium]|nr:divalent heavy-metal cations transporter [Actinomycetota bacterium]NBY15996.1 divalent heavy-metal cations transporter [Actinomycetota bacterium]
MNYAGIAVAVVTVLGTAFGGSLALRTRDKMHLLLGFSGGLLLGLAAFDLIPEVFDLSDDEIFHIPTVMICLVVGFLLLHIIERISGAHEPVETEYVHDHQHSHGITAGYVGAAAMVIHVFLDGVAIGLSFQVSNALGVAVAIAVVAHAFTDGLNTVALLVDSGNWRKQSVYLLGVDGVARLSGAALGTYILISERFVSLYLALFAGMIIYLATSHILPEAHSKHPSRLTLISTIAGVLVMFAIINVAHQ